MTHALETEANPQIATLLGMIRAEYREFPGLRLTLPQARRFWGLDETSSTALFSALVDAGFLRRTSTGAYVRADIG